MFQIIKPDTHFDFVGLFRPAVVVSIVCILIGLASLVMKGGPAFGIDFAGGTLLQVKFGAPTGAAEIKDALKGMELGTVLVQRFGDEESEFLIRMERTSEGLQGLGDQVRTELAKTYGDDKVELRRVEMVGPQVGKDLRTQGFMALFWALLASLVYIAWRFELRFSVGAIVALVHDVLITLGAFSLTNRPIDLPIIAAFLALIGYSLNDTIIVYDRIRENRGKYSKEAFTTVVNRSVNETLSRTILTSGTTLLVVIALFVLGGGVIHDFAFALLVGLLVGTYSSVFVASPLVVLWEKWKPQPIKAA